MKLALLAMLYYIAAPFCCVGAFHLSQSKRRSMELWMPLCLVLSFIGLAVLAILPKGDLEETYHEIRRRRDGLCAKCSYDLTGNVSGVCPECGTPVERSTKATT